MTPASLLIIMICLLHAHGIHSDGCTDSKWSLRVHERDIRGRPSSRRRTEGQPRTDYWTGMGTGFSGDSLTLARSGFLRVEVS